MNDKPAIGPNVRKLIFYRMSYDAIPSGTKDGLTAGVRFLSDPKRAGESFSDSHAFILACIKVVRTAAEPNDFKNADDETIAAEILRRIDERRDIEAKAKHGK